jgi:hypothetical protein
LRPSILVCNPSVVPLTRGVVLRPPSSLLGQGVGEQCTDLVVQGAQAGTAEHAFLPDSPSPPEVFVIVRPPPSKQNHPLNLQIQLITPSLSTRACNRQSGEYARPPMDSPSSVGGASFDAVAGAVVGGAGLQRTPSLRSNRSGRSGSSSAGSTSTGGAGGGGRRVTPLYNLNFHAVMATVVTDAGESSLR